MKVVFWEKSWTDYLYWQTHDAALAAKINELIKDTLRSPFQGIGKPEPLKDKLSGWWSRRITREHRLVYRVAGAGADQRLEVLSCRFHY